MKATPNFPDLSTPAVMGILNITPDSFYDGGRYHKRGQWAERAGEMIRQGAAIIDVGGSSTRPGSQGISMEEEWQRISPVIAGIRASHPDICISVDTCHAVIAERAVNAGADMVNDISGGVLDPEMAPFIGKRNIPFVMMHMQGRPENMQQNPQYADVVADIAAFFERQIKHFESFGAERLILDPGFGFGKTLEHNYSLLNNLERFNTFGYPVMAGLSRKSMINRALGISPGEALNATTVLNTIALLKGVKILRVHDVKEAVEAVKLVGLLC
jgi:dihydropteroate synthase